MSGIAPPGQEHAAEDPERRDARQPLVGGKGAGAVRDRGAEAAPAPAHSIGMSSTGAALARCDSRWRM